jgi:hypothetical protein
MDARQQAHINELTEQLRTAEHMSKKLREELAQAQAQMKAERATLQDQRLKEAQAWKLGTELTRASYQVTQARLLLLLDMEKRNVLSGEDAVRKERLARVQRDYQPCVVSAEGGRVGGEGYWSCRRCWRWNGRSEKGPTRSTRSCARSMWKFLGNMGS